MVVLRNGKASISQMLPEDLSGKTSFDIPDTSGSPTSGNFSNSFSNGLWTTTGDSNDGRYNAVAIGTGTTSASDTHTGLENETHRRGNTNIKTYLTDDTSNDQWKANWETTFTFSSAFSISEFGVHNKSTTNDGLCMMRQVLAEPMEVVDGDKLNVIMTLTLSGSNTTTTATAGTENSAGNQNVVTLDGLREICRLILSPNTEKRGEDDTSGDWQNDYTIGGISGRTEYQFDAIAIGDNNGDPGGTGATNDTSFDNTKNTLTNELASNGATRQYGDDQGDGSGPTSSNLGTYVRGSRRQEPKDEPWDGTNSETTDDTGSDGVDGGGEAFNTDSSEVFTGDTVQWVTKFTFSGTLDVAEWGVFNGNNKDGTGPPQDDPGVLLVWQGFNEALDHDSSSRLQPIPRLQVQ